MRQFGAPRTDRPDERTLNLGLPQALVEVLEADDTAEEREQQDQERNNHCQCKSRQPYAELNGQHLQKNASAVRVEIYSSLELGRKSRTNLYTKYVSAAAMRTSDASMRLPASMSASPMLIQKVRTV